MAYVEPNCKTKKELKQRLAAGETVSVFQPGPFSHTLPTDGNVALEGPHYPRPHTWYATGKLVAGRLVSVK